MRQFFNVRLVLVECLAVLVLGCSGSESAPSSAVACCWIATSSNGAGTNDVWATASANDQYTAASSALVVCERRAGGTCQSSILCSSPKGTWAGLSRELKGGTYSYRLDCNRAIPDDVVRAIACAACEVLWGPTIVNH